MWVFVKREIVFERTKMRGCSRTGLSLITRVKALTEFTAQKPFSQNWKNMYLKKRKLAY
jgi:hypothetical protein